MARFRYRQKILRVKVSRKVRFYVNGGYMTTCYNYQNLDTVCLISIMEIKRKYYLLKFYPVIGVTVSCLWYFWYGLEVTGSHNMEAI